MKQKSSKKIFSIISLLFVLGLAISAVFIGMRLREAGTITPELSEACNPDNYNECCGDGKSRNVTRNCDSRGNASYVVGPCNQTDCACGNCGSTGGGTTCDSGYQWDGSKCVCVAPNGCGGGSTGGEQCGNGSCAGNENSTTCPSDCTSGGGDTGSSGGGDGGCRYYSCNFQVVNGLIVPGFCSTNYPSNDPCSLNRTIYCSNNTNCATGCCKDGVCGVGCTSTCASKANCCVGLNLSSCTVECVNGVCIGSGGQEPTPRCGDGTCASTESAATCPSDCPGTPGNPGGNNGTQAGTVTTCTSSSQCPSNAPTCQNGVCTLNVTGDADGVCPAGYTNLPGSSFCDSNGTNCSIICILGEPGVVSGAQTPGSACVLGTRTACGSGCNSSKQQQICYATGWSTCVGTDACAPAMTQGASCDDLSQYSGGEPSRGAFVGCQGTRNCFCQGSGTNLTGTVVCYDDPGNDSCGMAVPTEVTPTPSPPIIPSGPTPPPTIPPSPPPGGDAYCERLDDSQTGAGSRVFAVVRGEDFSVRLYTDVVIRSGGSITNYRYNASDGSVDPVGNTSQNYTDYTISGTITSALPLGLVNAADVIVTDNNGRTSGGVGTPCSIRLYTTDTPIEDPFFILEKLAGSVCIDDPQRALVGYTISLTNIGTTGTINEVVDTLDSDITASMVSNINLGGTFDDSTNQITWNNNGAGFTLDPGEEMTFTYEVTFAASQYGTYTNTVEATVPDGTTPPTPADLTITTFCVLPGTAIISDSLDRILLGLILVTFGALIYRLGIYNLIGEKFSWSGIGFFISGISRRDRADVMKRRKESLERNLLEKGKRE